MTKKIRPASVLAVILGCVGLLACCVMAVGLWSVSARFRGLADRGYTGLGELVTIVSERLQTLQLRIDEAQVTAADVEQSVRDWAQQEVTDRVATELNIRQQADRLSEILSDADRWLEFSATATRIMQEALIDRATTATVGTGDTPGRVLTEIESLRQRVGDTAELARQISERLATQPDDPTLGERLQQVAEFAVRLVATSRQLNAGLEQCVLGLAEFRVEVDHWQARTRWWILLGSLGGAVLLAWMAAGQVCLAWHGWTRVRQRSDAEARG